MGRIDGLRVLGLGTPGGLRAELNDLVLSGAKTGTAGLLEHDYRAEDEELEASRRTARPGRRRPADRGDRGDGRSRWCRSAR
ncbi:hypothetical protein [Nonomuraea dietziae]|uniref:hypothetical protein n=1 Tax=Nonomuraea dietziae TaxID=65515 RepID=UPI0031D3780E